MEERERKKKREYKNSILKFSDVFSFPSVGKARVLCVVGGRGGSQVDPLSAWRMAEGSGGPDDGHCHPLLWGQQLVWLRNVQQISILFEF